MHPPESFYGEYDSWRKRFPAQKCMSDYHTNPYMEQIFFCKILPLFCDQVRPSTIL